MKVPPNLPERIYHLALRSEWDRVLASAGIYRRSTLGRSLEDEGFIHCSFGNQVQGIADLVYHGRRDVILLVINRSALDAEVRVESAQDGDQAYPHVYGPIAAEAVVEARDVPVGPDGQLMIDGLLSEL